MSKDGINESMEAMRRRVAELEAEQRRGWENLRLSRARIAELEANINADPYALILELTHARAKNEDLIARVAELESERDRLREWAVCKWHNEVSNRPLSNIHRRTLDDTWRQVIRYAGGDPVELLGPAHDDLLTQP